MNIDILVELLIKFVQYRSKNFLFFDSKADFTGIGLLIYFSALKSSATNGYVTKD